MPSEVTADPRLKDRDVRVYNALALFERHGKAKVGYRWLSQACHVPISKLKPSLNRLARLGYVECSGAPGKRQEYSLTAGIFTRNRAKAEAKGPISETVAAATEPKCPQCGTACKRLGKSGACRICVRKSNIEREVARILAVDPGANEEQIYLKVKARNAKEVRAAIKKVRVAA